MQPIEITAAVWCPGCEEVRDAATGQVLAKGVTYGEGIQRAPCRRCESAMSITRRHRFDSRPTGIARAIYVTRVQVGKTAIQFARKLGVSPAMVSQWETGKSAPSIMAMLRIGALAEGELRTWWIEELRKRLQGTVDVRPVLTEVAQR